MVYLLAKVSQLFVYFFPTQIFRLFTFYSHLLGIGYGLNENGEINWSYAGNWVSGLMNGFGVITEPKRPNYYYRGGWKEGRGHGIGERRNDDYSITTLSSVE